MEQIIKIGDKEVRLSNNVAWLMEYKEQFGKDATQELIPLMATVIEALSSGLSAYRDGEVDFDELSEAISGRAFSLMVPLYNSELSTTIIDIVWSMAKAADETIDPPKKWVKQFEVFPFDEIVPVVWKMNAEGFTSSKNLERLRTLLGKAKDAAKSLTNQPSNSTTSSSQESNED